MKKSIVIAACSLACAAVSAYAQVGLGGGVVGTLGANGAASSAGSLGSGISSSSTLRGESMRSSGQIGASTGADAKVNGSGIRAGTSSAAGATAKTPVLSGSTWGNAQADVQANTPDLQGTKDRAKSEVKNTLDGVETRRDRIEQRTDKAADKAVDKL